MRNSIRCLELKYSFEEVIIAKHLTEINARLSYLFFVKLNVKINYLMLEGPSSVNIVIK